MATIAAIRAASSSVRCTSSASTSLRSPHHCDCRNGPQISVVAAARPSLTLTCCSTTFPTSSFVAAAATRFSCSCCYAPSASSSKHCKEVKRRRRDSVRESDKDKGNLHTYCRASLQPSEEVTEQVEGEEEDGGNNNVGESSGDGKAEKGRPKVAPINKELNQVVMKTAATFAPRASTASKNPASPGTTLYKIFEAQAYVAMVLGGALSFNLLFPSDNPDIWRLMGMWSVWMFTVRSLRARDCSKNEKEALNYLFLAIPLINVTLPLVWKSFAAVWSADILAFFAIYAWKMEWLSGKNNMEDS